MRGIIIGTGRSGTGYMSKVLTEAGATCGHEQVFNYDGIINPSAFDLDASWMAVPYLSAYPGVPKILVHRHPAAVISSFMGIDFFGVPSKYRDFMYAKNPRLKNMQPFEAACEHYVTWNQKALMYATLVTELDDPDWTGVAAELDIDTDHIALAIPNVSQTTNHRQRANVDLDRIPVAVWETRAELMEATS